MKSIEPPESHYVSAAQGWIELGRYSEAEEELDKLSPALQHHPEVLQIRWLIHAHAKQWEACLEIAKRMVQSIPELPLGWINQANALFYLKRIEEAYELLLPIAPRFPENFIIPYNLACYTCQLGRAEEAWQWLQKAMALGDAQSVKSAALRDPDLAPMWDKIQQS